MSARGGASALVAAVWIVAVWLAACSNAPNDERSGHGASTLGRSDETMPGAVAVHVPAGSSQPSSHTGNDPDSPAPAAQRSPDGGAAPTEIDMQMPKPTMTHDEPDAGAPLRVPEHLRDAEPGTTPVLDPDRVYMLGENAEIGSNDPQELAAVEAQTDSVPAIGWFSQGWIRRSDGHLLYQDNNYGDPVREFVRDPVPLVSSDGHGLVDWHAGETELDSGSLPCNPGETKLTTQRRFKLGWDGKLYHTCGNYDVVPAPDDPDTQTWYDATGREMYTSKVWLSRVGAGGIAIGTRGGNELVVFEFDGGHELASIDITNQTLIAARMRADGFWAALRDESSHERSWLDIDLSGAVTARGPFAPMPEGVTYVAPGNSWSDGGAAALDAQGRLYEFASETYDGTDDNVVVVRRPPAEGQSDVPYRSHPTPTDEHDIFVMETVFFTGG